MRPLFHSLGHVFVGFNVRESNDITNIYVKSILEQKKCVYFHIRYCMSPEHFGIKNKDFHPL